LLDQSRKARESIPMQHRESLFHILFLLLLPLLLHSQVISLDGPVLDIGGARWKVIETAHYDIVFPESLENEARYVADTLEYLFPLQQESLRPVRLHRFSVVLDTRNFTANGYVSIFPRVSVYYSLPWAGEGGDWYTLLAVHEGRHMIQTDTVNQGPVRLFTLLFGEQGFLPLMAAPRWILEGDAVVMETLLTRSGRGRDPSFTLLLKSIALEENLPSYQTAILGSYRRMTPNAYDLGYLLYSRLRGEYAADAPDRIFSGIADLPLPLLGAWNGVRESSGIAPRKLYRETMEHYASFWREQTAALPDDPYEALTETVAGDYREYRNLVRFADGDLAAVRYSLSRGTEIELLSSGGTLKKRIRALPASRISAGGPCLAWDEHIADLKFQRGENRIMLYNRNLGTIRALTSRGRYIYPELSRDGSRLAVLEWKEDFSGELLILDTASGAIQKRYPLPETEFWSGFDWSPDNGELLYLNRKEGRFELKILDLEGGSSRRLRTFPDETISSPRFGFGGVIYSSSYSGIPSLYLLKEGYEPRMIQAGRLGRFAPQPAAGEDRIYFIDYTGSTGNVVGRAAYRPGSGLPLAQVPVIREEFYLPLLGQESGSGTLPRGPVPGGEYGDEYESREYSFSLEGTRLHSWTLLPSSPDLIKKPEIGLSLRADTISHTMGHELSLNYNINEQRLGTEYRFDFRRFRPELSLRAESVEPGDVETALAVNLPFGELSGDSVWIFEPDISLGAENSADGDQYRFPASYSLEASAVRGLGPRSIQPRFGIAAAADYTHEPFADGGGSFLSGRGSLFLPGLSFNHGTALGAAYERQNRDETSLIPFARGWSYRETEELAAFTADYLFPLAYPDIAFGGLALFKRLRGGLYIDRLSDLMQDELYSSAGAELNLDFTLFQIPVEFSIGLRGYYRLEDGGSGVQFLILGGSI
jgi:Tol biopolymer transport system component